MDCELSKAFEPPNLRNANDQVPSLDASLSSTQNHIAGIWSAWIKRPSIN